MAADLIKVQTSISNLINGRAEPTKSSSFLVKAQIPSKLRKSIVSTLR